MLQNFYKIILLSLTLFLTVGQLGAENHELMRYIDSFSQKMSQKYHLNLTTSLNLSENEINEVTLIYASNEALELKEARQLIENVAQNFVEALNKMASFQKPAEPFNQDQLEIIIFFRGKNHDYAAPPQIAQIYLQNNSASYYQYQNKSFKLLTQEKLPSS